MKMTELIAVVGIAGTLLGTLVGVGATFFVEVSRWRRDDHARLHSELYKRCAELYNASVLLVVWAQMPDLSAAQPDQTEWSLINKLLTASTHIRLVANRELSDAAVTLLNKCLEFDTADDPRDEELNKTLEDARDAFAEIASKELGVKIDGGSRRVDLEA